MSNTDQPTGKLLEDAGQLYGLNYRRFIKELDVQATELHDHGKYDDAEAVCLDALQKIETVYGEKSQEALPVIRHLVTVYSIQSLYSMVNEYCSLALEIIDTEHSDYDEFAGSLAEVYHLGGLNDKAEALYNDLLSLHEDRYGTDHPHCIHWLNQLAIFFTDRGRFQDAEPCLQRVLAIVQDCAGDDVASVATAMFNLASLYSCQERYEEAEFLIKRALNIREPMFGVVSCSDKLATVFVKQGRYDEAEGIFNRCLAQDQGSTFDLDYMIWLTIVYELRGEAELAEQTYMKIVDALKSDSVPAAPSHLESLADLADLHAGLGRDKMAESTYRFVLDISEREYGDYPFCTLEPVKDLVTFYESQERFDDARPYLERMVGIMERSFGSTHPMTEEARSRIARRERARSPSFPRPRFDWFYILMKKDVYE